MRRDIIIAAIVIFAALSSGCSEKEWCETGGAREIRDRIAPPLTYNTIHELLAIEPDGSIALFAHRGSYHCEEMDSAPENSLANLETAIQKGFDGYETDLWSSADGEFLIHHDETLDRTTTGTGDIKDITLEESRDLRLKYPSGKVSSEKIPTFRELLISARGRVLILVELKGGTPERLPELVEIARETESLEKVLFWVDWSPEYAALLENLMNTTLPEVKNSVLWRTRDMNALEDVIDRFDPIMVDIPPQQDELNKETGYTGYILGILPKQHLALVEAAKSHGVKVMVSKVTTNSYLKGLSKKGVRVFMSRAPEVQLDYLIDKGWHR